MVFKSCLEFGVGGGGNGREDEGFHPQPRDGPRMQGRGGIGQGTGGKFWLQDDKYVENDRKIQACIKQKV